MAANESNVIELPWRIICPGCGAMEVIHIRVRMISDMECPTEGCTKFLSDYVRENVD